MAEQLLMKNYWTQDKLDQLAETAGVPADQINLAMTSQPASDHLAVIGTSRAEERSLKRAVTAALADKRFNDQPEGTVVKGANSHSNAHHYTRDDRNPDVRIWSQQREELAEMAGINVKHIRVATFEIDGRNRAAVCIGGETPTQETANFGAAVAAANRLAAGHDLPRPQFRLCSESLCRVAEPA